MIRTGYTCVLAILLAVGAYASGSAQNQGHGSIYYSPSGNRVGWAKSLSSDGDADAAARAMCQGGQPSSDLVQEYRNGQAGASGTSGNAQPFTVVLSDCRRIIKFDSTSNHQCGGFGYSSNGNFSNGDRRSSHDEVAKDLSNWPDTFIICNNDRSVSTAEKIGAALGALADIFGSSNPNGGSSGGGSNQISANEGSNTANSANLGMCSRYLDVGSVMTWQSFYNGSLHAQGQLRITKVDGNYFEAIQTSNGMNQIQLYGMSNNNFIGLLNTSNDEAWIGNCTNSNITGFVKQYTFTITP
jgi:hypothetical protein